MLFGISFSPRQPSARQLYCHVKEYKLLILKIWNPFQMDKPESKVRNPPSVQCLCPKSQTGIFRLRLKSLLRTRLRLVPIDCMHASSVLSLSLFVVFGFSIITLHSIQCAPSKRIKYFILFAHHECFCNIHRQRQSWLAALAYKLPF